MKFKELLESFDLKRKKKKKSSDNAIKSLSKDLGENGQTMESSLILKDTDLSKSFELYRKNKAVGFHIDAKDETEAKRIGKRISKNLIAKSKLTGKSPDIHSFDIYIIFDSRKNYVKI